MKLTQSIVILLFIATSGLAGAEVFKCKSAGGKTIYQPEPCATSQKQKVVKIEAQTPEERQASLEKLRAWRDQQALQDAENAAKAKKDQERQQELARQQAAEQQLRMQQEKALRSQQPSGINRRFGYLP